MQSSDAPMQVANIDTMILHLRGQRVILDADLAAVYGVETRVLKQSVRRNLDKFPSDFMFSITRDETRAVAALRSQTVILKRGQHIKHLPCVFTEHGAIMAATILNSPQAVRMSVFIVILKNAAQS